MQKSATTKASKFASIATNLEKSKLMANGEGGRVVKFDTTADRTPLEELDEKLNYILALVEKNSHQASSLLLALTEGSTPARHLPTEEASFYCGFRCKDREHRAFLRFASDERIPFKQGNTKSQKLFDVIDLNRAMRKNRRTLDLY